jgi:hypothetical protein
MDQNIINWLMEGPAWLKYAVELQLLGSKPDIQPVLEDDTIKHIITRLKNPKRGIPHQPWF